MRTRIAGSIDALPLSGEQWRTLLAGSETNTVFQTREWFQCWWEAFGCRHRLLFCSTFDGDEPAGLAPFARRGDAGHTLAFAGDHHADYLDFVARGDRHAVLASMLTELLLQDEDWSDLMLRNLPAGSETVAGLRDLCAELGLYCLREAMVPCPTLLIDGHEAQVKRLATSAHLRRTVNRLRRMGRLTVREIGDAAEARALLPTFFDQHIRRWRDTETPSLFLKPANREFYSLLVERMLPTGMLLFTVAELDGRPISFHLGFDYGGRVLWYKPSYEPALAHYSPGVVQIAHLLEYALERGRAELDFSLGDEPFKRRYTNAARSNLYMHLYRGRSRYLLARGGWIARQIAKRALGRETR